MPANPIIIVGGGGHGRVVADIARSAEFAVAGVLDDDANLGGGAVVLGPVLPGIRAHINTHRFVVAIGDNRLRRRFSEYVLELGGELVSVIHPTAVLAPDVSIGAGTVIMALAVVNTGSVIGRFSVVNTGAIVDHDNLIEDNVHVSPGCNLAGGVICRKDSFIGIGATIIPRVEIGEGAYVAAGATVIRAAPPRTLVAGCPAVVKKRLKDRPGGPLDARD